MMLAKIALSAATFAIDRPYSYRVPAQLENLLEPGMRVLVPFGKGNRSSEGLVLSLEQAEDTHRLKEIQTLLDRRPVLTPEGIQLALWMRERFFCTVYAAALTMLPTGLGYVLKEGYALAPGVDRETWEAKTAGHPRARQVMTLLHGAGGRADLAQIRAIPDGKDPRGVLRELEKAGLVVRETQARRKVKDKTEQIASLAVDPAEALARMEPRRKTAPMGYEVTSLLCNLGSASVKELCYFTGASHQTVKSLEKRGILRLQEREVFRHQLPDIRQTQPLSPLNEAQQAAYEGEDPGLPPSDRADPGGGTGGHCNGPGNCPDPQPAAALPHPFRPASGGPAQLPVHRGAVRRVEAGPGWTGLCGHWDPFCGVCSPGGCGPYDFG